MSIIIRPVTTVAECRHIAAIMQAAWGAGPDIVVPDHATMAVASAPGGVVLLAWDGDKPVGFCWGFLTFVEGSRRLKHHSHLAGVLPDYRGQRVGERIKWAQADAVQALGLNQITWTFDPLQTLNANLNIRKLGTVCHTYKRNVYGKIEDELNWGLPSDRFQVDWWLDSPWVAAHRNGRFPHRDVAAWEADGVRQAHRPESRDGVLWPGVIDASVWQEEMLLTAVPRSFHNIKEQSMAAARAWRFQSRALFEQAFAAGFTAVDLCVAADLCYYLLQKSFDPQKDIP